MEIQFPSNPDHTSPQLQLAPTKSYAKAHAESDAEKSGDVQNINILKQ